MAYTRFLTARNLTIISLISLGGGYSMLKSKTLAQKQKERQSGDYSVSVERSGGGF